MTTGTSLMLIAMGAVLAFAVSFQIVGINIASVGAILMIVGIIGLAISVLTIVGYAPWNANSRTGPASSGTPQMAPVTPTQPTPATPQASVVVVNAPASGAAPSPAAAPVSPAAAAPAEVPPAR